MPARRPEQAATRLLERSGLLRLPVDVEALAEYKGASLSLRPLDHSVSGLLFRDGTRTIIGVNSSQPSTRMRFTIAHELGHLMLHKGRPVLLDRSIRVNWRDDAAAAATDREEIEANGFAAALLMPAELVHQHTVQVVRAGKVRDQRQLVGALAPMFNVSREAMSYRLMSLGLQRTS